MPDVEDVFFGGGLVVNHLLKVAVVRGVWRKGYLRVSMERKRESGGVDAFVGIERNGF